jgi:hypothetical protein
VVGAARNGGLTGGAPAAARTGAAWRSDDGRGHEDGSGRMIRLPASLPPGATDVPARPHGQLLSTVGRLPFVDGRLPRPGRLSEAVDGPAGQDLTPLAASDVLVETRGPCGQHARTAIAMPVMPLDSPVELPRRLAIDDRPAGEHT